MAWDDTDNEEYEEEYDDDEEEDFDDDGEARFPSTPYEEIYDPLPIEQIIPNIFSQTTTASSSGKYIVQVDGDLVFKESPPVNKSKKKSIKIIPMIFDLQNLDVPEDKNGRKKVR